MTISEFTQQLVEFGGSTNLFRSDQRSFARCYIEIEQMDQSKQYDRYKNAIQSQKSRFSFLDTKYIKDVHYEEKRWENGLGNFTINLANISTRKQSQIVCGDKVICYMWHSSAPAGSGVDSIEKFIHNPNNMAFVGIVDNVNTRISRDGTIVEISGYSLINQLDKIGSLSFSVEGDPVYIKSDGDITTNSSDDDIILDLDDNPIIIDYQPITFGEIVDEFFDQMSDFKVFNDLFIDDSYWDIGTSFGIDPEICRLEVRSGIFSASGSPLQILEQMRELARNIGGIKGVELFVEPIKTINGWKGKIVLRKSISKDEIKSGEYAMNPRRSLRVLGSNRIDLSHQQYVNGIFGRNIRAGDLKEVTSVVKNSVLVIGDMNFPDQGRDEISRVIDLIKSTAGLSQDVSNEIDRTEEYQDIISRDPRFESEVRVSNESNRLIKRKDIVRVFGLNGSDNELRIYEDNCVIIKMCNMVSAKKFGENMITISDPNISTFADAYELAKEILAIHSKPAFRGYATFVDERSDRVHLWNSLFKLQDHRKKSLQETGYQTIAGLDQAFDPRSKLGIFTVFNYYFHNKISKRFSDQGITTKIAFISDKRPGMEGLEDFKSLVKRIVYDTEKEKYLKLEVGTITAFRNETETDNQRTEREGMGIYVVRLDDLRFLYSTNTLQAGVPTGTSTVRVRLADFGYMDSSGSYFGMIKKPRVGDRVILAKIGDKRFIIGRFQSTYSREVPDYDERGQPIIRTVRTNAKPPFVRFDDELAMVTRSFGKLHYGDLLYSPHSTDFDEYRKDMMNISVGGARFIALIGKKYNEYQKHLNIYLSRGSSVGGDRTRLWTPRRDLFDITVNNYDDFNREFYIPPHPLGMDLTNYKDLPPLENCYWVQTQSGTRLFLGELYSGSANDGISSIDDRKSFSQMIGNKIQILAGAGWKNYSLNSGMTDWGVDKQKFPVPGRRRLDTNGIKVFNSDNRFEIVYLADNNVDNDDKFIMIRLSEDNFEVNYKTKKKIIINEDGITITEGTITMEITNTGVNVK